MRKLLLADDSITIHKVVELLLSGEGFEIKTTNNGEDALAAISTFAPDIILADVEMPKMNGYLLCEKIKQNPSTSNIPILLLAGAFEPFDEESAKKVGADGFVIKPFDAQELINKIHNAIASEVAGEEGVYATPQATLEEEAAAEEDLWAMEEIADSEKIEKFLPEEAEIEKEDVYKAAKELGVSFGQETKAPSPPPFAEEATTAEEAGILEVELPSKDELKEIFEKTIEGKLSSLLYPSDVKDIISSSFTSLMKDSVDKILGEKVSDIAEKIIHDEFKGIFEEIVSSRLASLMSSVDIKGIIETSLMRLIKESVEKILNEALPEKVRGIFEETVDAKISSLLSEVDIKETFEAPLTSMIREPLEKVVNESVPTLTEKVLTETLRTSMESITKEAERVINNNIQELTEKIFKDTLSSSLGSIVNATEKTVNDILPELIERTLKDELKASVESLKKEVEKVIWKTIPDLAESIITKEIERIRSEF